MNLNRRSFIGRISAGLAAITGTKLPTLKATERKIEPGRIISIPSGMEYSRGVCTTCAIVEHNLRTANSIYIPHTWL